MYQKLISELRAGQVGGPKLVGLTATPWRPDGSDVADTFGPPLIALDLITGMRKGFLSQVDYRIFTDNVDWKRLSALKGNRLTPRGINRTLFIEEWDEGVVEALRQTWHEFENPRCIVFCGNIDHALRVRDRVNALGFTNAEAIHAGSKMMPTLSPWERNRILSDLESGLIGVVCTVDMFNEGIDVPDVNLIVFQRVTHSRRIFIQQLGRGLRLAPGKSGVIVLDFVSDIRRFAAGVQLKDDLSAARQRDGQTVIRVNNKVTFRRAAAEDPESETFLRQWLEDVAAVEDAGDDAAVLKFPPQRPPTEAL